MFILDGIKGIHVVQLSFWVAVKDLLVSHANYTTSSMIADVACSLSKSTKSRTSF